MIVFSEGNNKVDSESLADKFASKTVIKKMSDWTKSLTGAELKYSTNVHGEDTTAPSPEAMDEAKSDKLEAADTTTSETTTTDADTKPSHSYIALIAMAILSKPSKKVLLGDIYSYISEKFPYYRSKDKSWRNSIRHNLSLNECFIKAGRSENGKGNYWAIHPANLEDFANGDFRRRRARRRVRKSHSTICARYAALPFQQHAFYRSADPYLQPYYLSPFALPNCVRKSNFAIDNLLSSRVQPAIQTPIEYATPATSLCSSALLRTGYTGQPYTGLSPNHPVSSYPVVVASNSEIPTESWQETWKKLKAQFQS